MRMLLVSSVLASLPSFLPSSLSFFSALPPSAPALIRRGRSSPVSSLALSHSILIPIIIITIITITIITIIIIIIITTTTTTTLHSSSTPGPSAPAPAPFPDDSSPRR